MQSKRWALATDYAGGTITFASLDYAIYASPLGHPSIVPTGGAAGTSYTGAQVQSGGMPGTIAYNAGSAFLVAGSLLYTSQANDYVQFTTTARQIVLTLSGYLGAGMGAVAKGANVVSNVVHNGAIVRVYLDPAGANTLLQTVDTYGALVQLPPISLDGTTHTIRIVHTGTVGPSSPGPSGSMMSVYNVNQVSGAAGLGSYTSQIIDSGDNATQWFLAEWQQGSAITGYILNTGQTPVPDSSWSSYAATDIDVLRLVDGTRLGYGQAGLISANRGRYAQWQLTFPSASASALWFRDMTLYWWTPETDPEITQNLAIGAHASPQRVMASVVGTLGTMLADNYVLAQDLQASYSIAGSRDQFLYNYASDLGLTPYAGEPQQALKARTAGPIQARPGGGSLVALSTSIAQLLYGVQTPLVNTSTQSTCAGVVVAHTGTNAITVTIPNSPWPSLPTTTPAQTTTAQQIILATIVRLTPVGCVVTVSPNPPV